MASKPPRRRSPTKPAAGALRITAARARRRGDAAEVRATDAKNQFGRLLHKASSGERVVITKHDAPAAVLMSFDDYRMLVRDEASDLDALSEEFDELLDRMQEPTMRRATAALFRASSQTLGKAAVTRVRKKSRTRARG